MSGIWATINSYSTSRHNPGLVRCVAWFMESFAQKMNIKMTLAPAGLVGEKFLIGYSCKDTHTGIAPRQVIWITASGHEEASPWRKQPNFRVERNPGGKSSASGRIFTHGLFPLLIPALTDGHIAVSASYKLGWNLCR